MVFGMLCMVDVQGVVGYDKVVGGIYIYFDDGVVCFMFVFGVELVKLVYIVEVVVFVCDFV